MSYALKRTRDGAGDSGLMSQAIFVHDRDEHGLPKYQDNSRPVVGACMRVGSHYARSYTYQDYWTTTPVTEILEEWTEAINDHEIQYVRFKTGNSEYIWSQS